MNKDIPINEASGVGVHSGHIQTTHYSSECEDKRIYTFLYNDIAAIFNFLILLMLFTIQHFTFILDIILYVSLPHQYP